MTPLRALHERLTDESIRLALLVGLATVPLTVALSVEPASSDTVVVGGSIAGEPLLVAGLFVGYLYSDRPTASYRAGLWTGITGSVAVFVVYLANSIVSAQSASLEMTIFTVVATPFTIGLGAGFTILLTVVAAAFSGWIRTRLARRGRGCDDAVSAGSRDDAASAGGREDVASADEHHGTSRLESSRWWLPVASYALVAPVVLGVVFVVRPESGILLGGMILGLFVLGPLAIVTLVSLFVETTTPRPRRADWVPNVWAYVGAPLAVYALVYVDALRRESINPSGDGMYGFVAALWVAAVVFLVFRQRSARRV